ncbi:MAG: site-specific integrase [Akkermansiaceae bacterium]|nr:site-specific integrase [Akkermansiaceae bacterium]
MKNTLLATDYPNLYRSKESGIFYARSDEGRRTVKKSLKTRVFTEALARLAAFLEERGREEMPVESVSWHLAVDMYVQRQEMRPNLKPAAMESIKFFSGRAKKLVDHDMSTEAITESMCRIWWKKDALTVSPRTANGTLSIVKNVFSMLHEAGCIKSNPATKLERMRVQQGTLNIPSRDDFRRILEEARKAPLLGGWKKSSYSEAADMIAFLAYSGLRIEEARRLVWGDIGKESISVPDIKHATSRRTLYINASLANVIESLRRERRGNSSDDPVFTMESPRKALTNASIRLGLPHVRIHDLRHFFATSCIEAGINIPTVAKWLGHRDGGALAMRVYGHLRDEHSKEAAKRLTF